MIKIIKYIITYGIGFIYYLDKISGYTYKLILNTFIVQLKVVSIRELFKFFKDLLTNNLNNNTLLSQISFPQGFNWKSLIDTKPKKIYLLTITSTVLIYRSIVTLKKIFLWPFKLGILSLFYSILGFDVTWFLNLFNLFTINIPQWVYFQYLLLYGNWMNWWHNIVNIKSLNTNPFSEKNESSMEIDEKSKFNLKRYFLYLLGLLIMFGIFYFFYFDGASTDGSSTSTQNVDASQIETESRPKNVKKISRKIQDRINERRKTLNIKAQILDTINDAVLEGSGSPSNLAETMAERYPESDPERAPSPAGSDDSSDTITPSAPGDALKEIVYEVYKKTRNK